MTNATEADIGAMSAEELDSAIAQLRRRQEELAPVINDAEDVPDFSTSGDGWETDAANLRGDMERVGLDMWIGILRTEQARKVARR
ncbi:MAG: hypothetical protein ACR2P4_06550 [Gammaproteobacteria bacterium]